MRGVGQRIAELRAAREMTQQELADQLDVTPRYIRSVEAGQENLTLTSLAGLASILKSPVATLFDEPATRAVLKGRPGRRS